MGDPTHAVQDTRLSSLDASMEIPRKMLAARLRGRGLENLRIEDAPVPIPGRYQLLVRVDAAGVCASNLKLLALGSDHPFMNGWDLAKWPIQPGDEGCVTVVAAGSGVRELFPIGQRCCIQPAVGRPPVHHLDRYRDHAAGMGKVAIGYTLPGHFAQYMLVTEDAIDAGCVLPIPDATLAYYAAALAEPISCVISAQGRHVHFDSEGPRSPRVVRVGLRSGGVTLIVGAGPMGRVHAEAALQYKPRHIVLMDLDEGRLRWVQEHLSDRAAQIGVEVHAFTNEVCLPHLERLSGGLGADDIIIAVGVGSVQTQAQQWLARGGVLDLFGGLPRGEHLIELDTLRVHYDEIRVCGSSGGTPADMIKALDLIADGSLDPSIHLAMVGGLEELPKALIAIQSRAVDGKIVLYPNIKSTPLTPVVGWTQEQEAAFLREHAL
jgi:L-iditol 2-dehydrogenase